MTFFPVTPRMAASLSPSDPFRCSFLEQEDKDGYIIVLSLQSRLTPRQVFGPCNAAPHYGSTPAPIRWAFGRLQVGLCLLRIRICCHATDMLLSAKEFYIYNATTRDEMNAISCGVGVVNESDLNSNQFQLSDALGRAGSNPVRSGHSNLFHLGGFPFCSSSLG